MGNSKSRHNSASSSSPAASSSSSTPRQQTKPPHDQGRDSSSSSSSSAAHKSAQHLEAAAQEQKELLAASTRTIRNLESNVKRVQTTHREELAECKAQVQLAKSKTVSVIDAKREMGLRYQKCVAARKELELRLEKRKHDEAQAQRKFESERQTLERRLRAVKEKTQRESHAALARLSQEVERAQAGAAEERETHEVTHRALRSAHAELDELHTRLAEAEAEAERLSSHQSGGRARSQAAYPSHGEEWGGGSGASPIEHGYGAGSGGGLEGRASISQSSSGRRRPSHSRQHRGENTATAGPSSFETAGRPPRPPGSGGRGARESSPRGGRPEPERHGGGVEGEEHGGYGADRRQEDSALLSAPSHFAQQNPRVAGILEQHSSFLEEPSLDSPGQRAAAVIMGATDFVRRRSAKRKSRKRGGGTTLEKH